MSPQPPSFSAFFGANLNTISYKFKHEGREMRREVREERPEPPCPAFSVYNLPALSRRMIIEWRHRVSGRFHVESSPASLGSIAGTSVGDGAKNGVSY